MELSEQLSRVGLAGKRSDVYLSLLQTGAATATQISQSTRIKRPTVYDILNELGRMGLVGESRAGKRRVFSAESPSRLQELLDRQQQSLATVLPELQALYDGGPHRPRMRFYQGAEGVRTVSEDILTVRAKEYFWFGSMKEVVEVTSNEYQQDWVRRRIEAGIWSNSIRVREREPTYEYLRGTPENLRRLRFFPRPVREDVAGLYIYDNKVAVTSALKECYGLIIESRELALLLKTLWECLWDIAEEP